MITLPLWTFGFHRTARPDFYYEPMKGPLNKGKREMCDVFVFERYLRIKDAKKAWIPCSENKGEVLIHLPKIKLDGAC